MRVRQERTPHGPSNKVFTDGINHGGFPGERFDGDAVLEDLETDDSVARVPDVQDTFGLDAQPTRSLLTLKT